VAAVANVAINLDSRGVPAKLKQIQQASSNLDSAFKKLKGQTEQVKSAIQAQQSGFAKASTVQKVFSARVLNTEKAIRAQISALREVQSSVKLNGALYQKAGQQIKQYEQVLRNANKEEERGVGIKQRAGKVLSGLRGALLSIGAGAAISTSFGDAQALSLAQKRLARLTEEYQQFAGAQQEAERLASKFELSVTETAGALSNLGSRLGAQGVTLEEIVAVYEGMNSALVATGRSASEASSASYQLAQALGSGSLTGDELKTISETLPELLNAVAAAAGKSSTEIREMAKEGALSADLIIEATKTLRDKYEKDVAANITQTQKFRNALGSLSEAIGTELAPSITELLKGATEMLKLFGKLPGPVKTLTAAALGLTAAFVALAPAITAVVGLLGGITASGIIAAAPWIAVAAGLTAVGVAAYDGTVKAQEFQNKLSDLSGTSTELADKMVGVRNNMDALSEDIKKGGRAGAVAKKKYDALAETLKNLQGTYSVRVEIEELFKGGKKNEKLPTGYSRAEDGRLLNTVSGITYDVATGAAYTPPQEPKGGGGGGATAKTASAGTKAAAKVKETDAQRAAKIEKIRAIERDIFEARHGGNEVLAAQLEAFKRQVEIQQRGLGIEEETQLLLQNGERLNERLKELDDQRLERLSRFLQGTQELIQAQNDIVGNYQEETQLLELRAQKGEEFVQKFKDVNRLVMEGGLSFSEAFSQVEARTAAMASLNQEADLFQQALQGAGDIIGNQLRGAIDGLIDGTADWNDILQSTLKQLGSFFLNFGLNALAGPAGSGGILSFLGFGTRANGGPVNANKPYIVGERGPELFMPNQSGAVVNNNQLSSAMNRYRRSGTTATNESAAAMQGGEGGTAVLDKPIDVRYSVERINNVDYVTAEQFQQGMRQAAQQGAVQGEQRTLRSLRQNTNQRRRIGI
jgi:tape measure domain-containing protein